MTNTCWFLSATDIAIASNLFTVDCVRGTAVNQPRYMQIYTFSFETHVCSRIHSSIYQHTLTTYMNCVACTCITRAAAVALVCIKHVACTRRRWLKQTPPVSVCADAFRGVATDTTVLRTVVVIKAAGCVISACICVFKRVLMLTPECLCMYEKRRNTNIVCCARELN